VPGSDSRRRRGLGRVLVGNDAAEGMTGGSHWSATQGAGARKRAGGLAGLCGLRGLGCSAGRKTG
jgi:hypothetical protein